MSETLHFRVAIGKPNMRLPLSKSTIGQSGGNLTLRIAKEPMKYHYNLTIPKKSTLLALESDGDDEDDTETQSEVEVDDESFIDDDDAEDSGMSSELDEAPLPVEPTSLRVMPKKSRGAPGIDNLERISTIGTGTFGRVILCQEILSKKYRALKVMPIKDVIDYQQVDHVFSEKRILQDLDHPFIVNLHWAHRDNSYLYMLFEYIPGGELFSYLRAMDCFTTATGRFYAVEIILALEYLHKRDVAYRDLKPENLLLDKEGHLKITDFGFAKRVTDRTYTVCGTPEYLAPEIVEGNGHGKAVDWWALGVLIYEMLAGFPPFRGNTPDEIYKKILRRKMRFPEYFDKYPKNLVKKLLTVDPSERLGNMENGAEDVKRHKWFRSIDWMEALERKLQPPIVPKVAYEGDPGNYDLYAEDKEDASAADEDELKMFEDW